MNDNESDKLNSNSAFALLCLSVELKNWVLSIVVQHAAQLICLID